MTEPTTGYLMGRVDRILRAELEVQLADHELTLIQITALSVLIVQPGLSNAQLARRTLVTPQAMHNVTKSLEEAAMIERSPAPEGGRSLISKVTPKGHESLERASVMLAKGEAVLLEQLDDEEKAAFHRILLKVARYDVG